MNSITLNGELLYPKKIVCVGKNYKAHIEEMNSHPAEEMVVFLKPACSISKTLSSFEGETLHYEGEICLLILGGEIAGIGFGIDVTKRATQSKLKAAGLPWERAKAFDKSAVFSDFINAPTDLIGLSMELVVNGTTRQKANTSLMLYSPKTILEQVKKILVVEDYDIIMTGTPAGVGPIMSGDRFVGRLLDSDHELVKASWVAR